MPDIDTYLANIQSAVYGEQVRGSIHDAIEEINEVVENWESGLMDTTLTSETLPAQGKAVGDAVNKSINSIDYLDIGNLEKTDIYYVDPRWRFVRRTTRLSFGTSLITLKKGDIIRCNIPICILLYDDPTVSTPFGLEIYVPRSGRYYMKCHKADESDIELSDVQYITVNRINVNGFMYGEYLNMNSNSPTYTIRNANYIVNDGGYTVNIGDVINLPPGRTTVTIVYSDGTYTYYGAVNGIVIVEKQGTLYMTIETGVFCKALLGTDRNWFFGTTANGKTVTWNTSRITGNRKALSMLPEKDMAYAFYDKDGDSGWTSALYHFNQNPGTYTVRKSDNSALDTPNVLQYDPFVKLDNIFAHRGMNIIAPENTLAALLCAKSFGFGGTEFDVRFTSDNIPVIIHDATINRTARTKSWQTVPGEIYVEDLTYNNLITNYYFDSTFYAKQNIPTLEQYIMLSKMLGMRCLLEIAHQSRVPYTREQVQQIVDIVKKYSYLDKTVFISFNFNYLSYVSDYYSDADIGYITTTMSDAYINDTLRMRQNYPKLGLSYAGNNDELSLKCINNGIRLYANSGDSTTMRFRGEVLLVDGYPPKFAV